jgi:hypothetical protein
MNIYKHTQIGYVIIFAMAGVAVALALAPLPHQTTMLMVFPSAILLIGGILFCSLTIEINDTRLRWSFGPGLIHKSVDLTEIEAVEAFRIHWINGWGIHFTRKGWLYNVSGMDAVHIRLKNGKQFCLGTDEAGKLEAAIQSALVR